MIDPTTFEIVARKDLPGGSQDVYAESDKPIVYMAYLDLTTPGFHAAIVDSEGDVEKVLALPHGNDQAINGRFVLGGTDKERGNTLTEIDAAADRQVQARRPAGQRRLPRSGRRLDRLRWLQDRRVQPQGRGALVQAAAHVRGLLRGVRQARLRDVGGFKKPYRTLVIRVRDGRTVETVPGRLDLFTPTDGRSYDQVPRLFSDG